MPIFQNLKGTTTNEFSIGDGSSGNKTLKANTSATNKPSVRYNDTTDKWEISHDGSTFTEVSLVGHTQAASTITPALLGTPTYDDLQDYLSAVQSGGRIEGGVLSDDGSGGINISALKAIIKTTDSETGGVVFFDMAAGNIPSASLTNNATNYIYVNYNSGSPAYATTTDRTSIKETNQFTLGRAYKKTGDIEILQSGINLYNFLRREHERLVYRGVERASGGVISEVGQRYVSTTAGIFYVGTNKLTTSAKNTSTGDTFTSYYRNGSGGWTEVTGQTQCSNLLYDNGTGTLATLTNNKYGVHWFYICFEGNIYKVYGQGDYTLAEAQNASLPSTLPDYLVKFANLSAKVIIAKSGTNFYSNVSAYSAVFNRASVTIHNDLGSIQGGTSDQYYHLTSAQHTAVDTAIQSTLVNAKGDIIVASGDNAVTNFAVGTNDYILTADSTTATGLKWIAGYPHSHILDAGLWFPVIDYSVTSTTQFTVTNSISNQEIFSVGRLLRYAIAEVSKFPADYMTTNSLPSPLVASAVTEINTPAYKAFDGIFYTDSSTGIWYWAYSGDTWVKIDLGSGNEKSLLSYEIASFLWTPKDWTIDGSNDNSNWTTVHSATDVTSWSNGVLKSFIADNDTQYRYYRILITGYNHGSIVSISELKFYTLSESNSYYGRITSYNAGTVTIISEVGLSTNNTVSMDYCAYGDIEPDGTLAANSDALVPTQKAVKTYADTKAALIHTHTAVDTAIQSTLVNAKGDIIVASGDNAVTNFAVGTNNYVLTADSTTATGLKWAAGGTTLSDIPFWLADGTRDDISLSGGMIPFWLADGTSDPIALVNDWATADHTH